MSGCCDPEKEHEAVEERYFNHLENISDEHHERISSLESWTYFGISALAISNIFLWVAVLTKK